MIVQKILIVVAVFSIALAACKGIAASAEIFDTFGEDVESTSGCSGA